jgi:hypothetical protein
VVRGIPCYLIGKDGVTLYRGAVILKVQIPRVVKIEVFMTQPQLLYAVESETVVSSYKETEGKIEGDYRYCQRVYAVICLHIFAMLYCFFNKGSIGKSKIKYQNNAEWSNFVSDTSAPRRLAKDGGFIRGRPSATEALADAKIEKLGK